MNQVFSGAVKGLGIVAAMGIFLFGFQWWEGRYVVEEEKKLASVSANLSEFLQIASSRKKSIDWRSPVGRKVVFVTMEINEQPDSKSSRGYRKIDPLTLKLPESMRPVDASEVQTVVAVYWGQQYVGQFDNRDTAYRQTCRVEVFDRATGAMIVSRNFSGGEPPQQVRTVKNKSYSQKHFGSSCDDKIIELLRELCRA